MNLRIRVTANDILKGCRTAHNNCPIARSIKRNKGVKNVVVGQVSLAYNIGHTYHFALLPKMARQFVNNFDEGVLCEPFEFTIETKETPISSAKVPNNDIFP